MNEPHSVRSRSVVLGLVHWARGLAMLLLASAPVAIDDAVPCAVRPVKGARFVCPVFRKPKRTPFRTDYYADAAPIDYG